MRHIIRNIRNLFKCYTQSTVFNIVGLSLAFAACYIIYVQTSYEFGFGKADANYERIYKSKLIMKGNSSSASLGVVSDKLTGMAEVEAVSRRSISGGNHKLRVEIAGEWESVERYTSYLDTSANRVFDFDMVVGRFEAIENPDEVIIPLSMADEFFGGADNAMTKQVKLEGDGGATYTIGGVYRDFSKLSVLNSNMVYNKFVTPDYYNMNAGHSLYFKLREGASIQNITDVANNLVDSMMTTFGMDVATISIEYIPVGEMYFDKCDIPLHPVGNRTVSLSLVFVGILVLIIAIINFVNFSIAHAPRRLKAMNTYRILGHSLAGLRALIVMEAVFIAVVSSFVGMLLVYYIGQSPFAEIIVTSIKLGENAEAIMVVVASAVVVGAIAGAFPAYYITNFRPAVVLNGGKSLPHSAQFMRNVLVAMQYVISIAMIIVATFVTMQNQFLLNYSAGYNPDNLVICMVQSKQEAIKEQLLSKYPFIESAAYSSTLIASDMQGYGILKINNDDSRLANMKIFMVTPKFVSFLGLEVVEGDFTGEEVLVEGESLLAVNQTAQEMYDLKIGDRLNDGVIKAIIADATLSSLRGEIAPTVFWMQPDNQSYLLYVRYKNDPEGKNLVATRDAIEEVFADVLPGVDGTRSRCFNESREEAYKSEANLSTIISWSALLSIIIAIIGVVGLVSLEAQQRTREIAIRKACGATTTEILRMLNLKFIKIVTACFVVAVPIAYLVVNSWLSTMAYKVAMNPFVFVGAGLLIMIITIVIVTIVSYKAANTNPAEAMK